MVPTFFNCRMRKKKNEVKFTYIWLLRRTILSSYLPMNCKRCQTEISTPFCPACGHPQEVKRIDGHYVLHDLFHVLHLERGIFYTIWQLWKAPGVTIREFIREDRTKIVKPVLFLIVTSLVYTIFMNFTHFKDSYFEITVSEEEKFVPSYIRMIFEWVQTHHGYANLLTSGFVALWLQVFFKKQPYNFFELMVLLCYALGMGMLIFFLFGALSWLSGVPSLNQGNFFSTAYIVYALARFYQKAGFRSYFKAFWAYFLGFLSFVLILTVVGLSLDYKAGNLEKLKQKITKSDPIALPQKPVVP